MSTPKTLKRKRLVLTIEAKIEIIERLQKGESQQSLADQFKIGKSTVSDLWKKREDVLYFAAKLDNTDGSKRRKVMKQAKNVQLEEALFMWFIQRRSRGDPISGPLLTEKALYFNEQLGGPSDFKASQGYLHGFKSRHGIRLLNTQGESLSGDSPAATEFRNEFPKLIEGYSLDSIYNVDETGLLWRSLPRKSLASRRERTAAGFKVSKDRITLMVGANANGSHALPLLMIGKSAKPRCFKNVKSLPLCYKNQRKAWMSGEIFIDWYRNEFLPEVKKFRKERGLTGPVLLILDNAPTHPAADILNEVDPNFKVIYLPPNVTALLQPMDQGVIEKFKRLYRKLILRRLLAAEDEENLISFAKKMNLLDCCYMVVEAWSSLTPTNLSKSWNKLLGTQDQEDESTLEDIVALFKELPGFSDCDWEDAQDWMGCDENDPGYQVLTDREIVDAVQNEEDDDEEDDDDVNIQDKRNSSRLSHQMALSAAETLIEWYQQEPNFCPAQMLLLRRMRDHAAVRRRSTLVQKKVSDYFK